jgi:hypothetical protein
MIKYKFARKKERETTPPCDIVDSRIDIWSTPELTAGLLQMSTG